MKLGRVSEVRGRLLFQVRHGAAKILIGKTFRSKAHCDVDGEADLVDVTVVDHWCRYRFSGRFGD